jgi:hypothetical protein
VIAAKVKALVKRRSEMRRDRVMPEAVDRSSADLPISPTVEQANAKGESSPIPQPAIPKPPQPTEASEARPVDAHEFGRGWSLLQWLYNWVAV